MGRHGHGGFLSETWASLAEDEGEPVEGTGRRFVREGTGRRVVFGTEREGGLSS
jgi:hypothetical protein